MFYQIFTAISVFDHFNNELQSFHCSFFSAETRHINVVLSKDGMFCNNNKKILDDGEDDQTAFRFRSVCISREVTRFK